MPEPKEKTFIAHGCETHWQQVGPAEYQLVRYNVIDPVRLIESMDGNDLIREFLYDNTDPILESELL